MRVNINLMYLSSFKTEYTNLLRIKNSNPCVSITHYLKRHRVVKEKKT